MEEISLRTECRAHRATVGQAAEGAGDGGESGVVHQHEQRTIRRGEAQSDIQRQSCGVESVSSHGHVGFGIEGDVVGRGEGPVLAEETAHRSRVSHEADVIGHERLQAGDGRKHAVGRGARIKVDVRRRAAIGSRGAIFKMDCAAVALARDRAIQCGRSFRDQRGRLGEHDGRRTQAVDRRAIAAVEIAVGRAHQAVVRRETFATAAEGIQRRHRAIRRDAEQDSLRVKSASRRDAVEAAIGSGEQAAARCLSQQNTRGAGEIGEAGKDTRRCDLEHAAKIVDPSRCRRAVEITVRALSQHARGSRPWHRAGRAGEMHQRAHHTRWCHLEDSAEATAGATTGRRAVVVAIRTERQRPLRAGAKICTRSSGEVDHRGLHAGRCHFENSAETAGAAAGGGAVVVAIRA